MNRFADALTTIFSSASKIVFLAIAVCVCVGFLSGKLTQDNFMYIATSVFSYYFGVTVGSLPDSGKPMPMPLMPGPSIPPKDEEAAVAQVAVK